MSLVYIIHCAVRIEIIVAVVWPMEFRTLSTTTNETSFVHIQLSTVSSSGTLEDRRLSAGDFAVCFVLILIDVTTVSF